MQQINSAELGSVVGGTNPEDMQPRIDDGGAHPGSISPIGNPIPQVGPSAPGMGGSGQSGAAIPLGPAGSPYRGGLGGAPTGGGLGGAGSWNNRPMQRPYP